MSSSFFTATKIEEKERQQEHKLWEAFERSRKRHTVSLQEQSRLRHNYRAELSAVNHHARILWGDVISDQLSTFFCKGGNGSEHGQDIHFVTLVDCLTKHMHPGSRVIIA